MAQVGDSACVRHDEYGGHVVSKKGASSSLAVRFAKTMNEWLGDKGGHLDTAIISRHHCCGFCF